MLFILIYILITVLVLYQLWTKWKKRGSMLSFAGWLLALVAVYAALVYLLAGPGSGIVNRLSAGQFFTVVAVFGLTGFFGVLELGFRVLEGPFPAVKPVQVYRRKTSKWMAAAAGAVLIMALGQYVAPLAWRENLTIATYLVALFAAFSLWFSYYKARRFDYGLADLTGNSWVRWQYPGGELEAFAGLDPNAIQEAWMGPAGLFYVGDFAPWDLYIYKLVQATFSTGAPARITFTFKKTGLGDSTATDIMRVPVPRDRAGDLELIARELKACCPDARIEF